jgi:hypothetical protein
MLAFITRHNYLTKILPAEGCIESVGVLTSSGEIRYYRWLGTLPRETALQARTQGAIAVRVQIHALCFSGGTNATQWLMLNSDQYLLGCLTSDGVYVVLREDYPSVIKGPKQ